jgi:hypothetical protein
MKGITSVNVANTDRATAFGTCRIDSRQNVKTPIATEVMTWPRR